MLDHLFKLLETILVNHWTLEVAVGFYITIENQSIMTSIQKILTANVILIQIFKVLNNLQNYSIK